MLDLKDNEMSWFLKHMGHSFDVHENYYRTMSSVIERSKVGLLLLLSEEGRLGLFQRKAAL